MEAHCSMATVGVAARACARAYMQNKRSVGHLDQRSVLGTGGQHGRISRSVQECRGYWSILWLAKYGWLRWHITHKQFSRSDVCIIQCALGQRICNGAISFALLAIERSRANI